ERDNLRAALQWTLDEARYTDAAWLMVGVHYFWHFHGHWYEGARGIEQLLPHRHALATDLCLALWINLYAYTHGLEEFQLLDHRYRGEVMQLVESCTDKLLQT